MCILQSFPLSKAFKYIFQLNYFQKTSLRTMAAVKVLIFTIIFFILGLCNMDDFQIVLSHGSIQNMAEHFIPAFKAEMMEIVIPSQTIQQGVFTLNLAEITIKNFSLDNITMNLDQETQLIQMNLINMDLLLNRLQIKASIGLSCDIYVNPEFIHWNISLSFNMATNNCTISINLLDSETIIEEGALNLNVDGFSNTLCEIAWNGADLIVGDLEETIKSEIVEAIPDLINTELQAALNAFLEENANEMGDAKICYKNITIFTNHLLIAGDINTPKIEPNGYSTTPFIEDGPRYDDLSLFIFVIVFLIASCLCGCGIGVCIFWACNKNKLDQWNQYLLTRTDNVSNIEAAPIKIADHEMTDIDEDGAETTNDL